MEKNDTLSMNEEGIGEVQIANEVIATIAGISAAEVDGVDSLAGGFTNELAGKFGVKNYSKGVKVVVEEDSAIVDLAVNMKYGYSIPKTCKAVQDRVKNGIDSMTGLKVTEVNIRIAGVALEHEK